ncbi:MAG: carboxypeptidase-like regulatory domain-containing protein [Psychroflexus sp.]|nr:carboxypeptidase-like regulatory domain-containing protein [Psychroflexus sp.]
MHHKLIYIIPFFLTLLTFGQEKQLDTIKGQVVNAANDKPLEGANIININTVKGTISDENGNFIVKASENDTLFFSYLGFRNMEVKVTKDWLKYGEIKIKMTEKAIALEEVTVRNIKLTGYLEIDARNIPIYDTYRYQISGLQYGYEAGDQDKSSFAETVSSLTNPADLLYNIFGNRPQQMKRIQKMKEDDEIRKVLQDKYDRETLAAVLQVNKSTIEEILKRCNFSKRFVQEANDLQILDAMGSCYQDYKAIKR